MMRVYQLLVFSISPLLFSGLIPSKASMVVNGYTVKATRIRRFENKESILKKKLIAKALYRFTGYVYDSIRFGKSDFGMVYLKNNHDSKSSDKPVITSIMMPANCISYYQVGMRADIRARFVGVDYVKLEKKECMVVKAKSLWL